MTTATDVYQRTRFRVEQRTPHWYLVRDTYLGRTVAQFTEREQAAWHAARREQAFKESRMCTSWGS